MKFLFIVADFCITSYVLFDFLAGNPMNFAVSSIYLVYAWYLYKDIISSIVPLMLNLVMDLKNLPALIWAKPNMSSTFNRSKLLEDD